MTHLERLQITADTIGVSVEVDDAFDCISLGAPVGFVFLGSDCHYLDVYYGDMELHASQAQAARWLLGELKIKPCEEKDCELCGEEQNTNTVE